MKSKPIIIIAGQPESIFFEIFFKSIKSKNYKSPLIIICCKELYKAQMKKYKSKKKFKLLKLNELNKIRINNKFINLIDVNLKKSSIIKNQLKFTKEYINESFEIATKLIKKKLTYKLINGPINKKKFLEKKFFGVTEFISEKFKKKTGMLIYNEKFSVSTVTTHLPIKMISKKISKKILREKIKIIDQFYRKYLKFRPRIAVTGLNPHCESILKYNEDEKILLPAIKLAKKMNYNVKGPFPADTIFLKDNRKNFDVILGMYHDQVLSPFKTLFEYDAINITMGLPFLRLSPDHGPNEKMIGKNLSNPVSLIKALEFLDKR